MQLLKGSFFMSIRSVIIGFLGVIVLCGFTFFNDMVIRGTFLVGNFLPISILGTVILFVLIGNPLLRLFGQKAPLTGRELAVIIGMVLFVCFIPGRGFMHHFTNNLMFPHHYSRTNTAWKGEGPKIPFGRIIEWHRLAERLEKADVSNPDDAVSLVKSRLSRTSRGTKCGFHAIMGGGGGCGNLPTVVMARWFRRRHVKHALACAIIVSLT